MLTKIHDVNRSFNDKPINEEKIDSMGKELFEKEQDDLLVDLIDIPRKACDRQVNVVYHITKSLSNFLMKILKNQIVYR